VTNWIDALQNDVGVHTVYYNPTLPDGRQSQA
jgi:hypothetical protein